MLLSLQPQQLSIFQSGSPCSHSNLPFSRVAPKLLSLQPQHFSILQSCSPCSHSYFPFSKSSVAAAPIILDFSELLWLQSRSFPTFPMGFSFGPQQLSTAQSCAKVALPAATATFTRVQHFGTWLAHLPFPKMAQ